MLKHVTYLVQGQAHYSHSLRICCCSVAQSFPALRLAGLQHARLPCPSPSPGVCSNSCPLSRWCQATVLSSVLPFKLLYIVNTSPFSGTLLTFICLYDPNFFKKKTTFKHALLFPTWKINRNSFPLNLCLLLAIFLSPFLHKQYTEHSASLYHLPCSATSIWRLAEPNPALRKLRSLVAVCLSGHLIPHPPLSYLKLPLFACLKLSCLLISPDL